MPRTPQKFTIEQGNRQLSCTKQRMPYIHSAVGRLMLQRIEVRFHFTRIELAAQRQSERAIYSQNELGFTRNGRFQDQ